jgi:hypothetical protein
MTVGMVGTTKSYPAPFLPDQWVTTMWKRTTTPVIRPNCSSLLGALLAPRHAQARLRYTRWRRRRAAR